MSHIALSTQEMAFSNKSRSFANMGSADVQDNKTNGNGNLASLGGGAAWRPIGLGNNAITSGLAGNHNSRDASRLRDSTTQTSATTKTTEITGKTGSGSLVESSVSDDDSYRTAWGTKRSLTSGRSIPQPQHAHASHPQQKSMSNAGLAHTTPGASQNNVAYASPPPTINLTSTSTTSAQPRPSFSSSFASGIANRSSEQPPFNVYTKFDRPPEPFQRKPDSAIGSWAESTTTPSPSEERRPQLPSHFGRTASMPVSRDGSLPPSRHSDEAPMFNLPDYSRSAQHITPASSRAPSFSSSRNGTYGSYSTGAADQIAGQMGQLTMNSHSGRPGTSHKPTSINGFHNTATAAAPRGSTFTRSSFQGQINDVERSDDVEEIDRSRFARLTDDYATPQHGSNFGDPSRVTAGDQYPQAVANLEFRPGQTFNPSRIPARSFDVPHNSLPAADWQTYSPSSLSMSRRSPGMPDQQQLLDYRLHQMMAAQLRNPYASAMFNPYTIPSALQLNQAGQFPALYPLAIAGMDPLLQHDPSSANNVQSALMYEFKSNTKAKRYELGDIYDHIAEFSGDQHGSRFIQTKLETANSDEKERVFREIEPNAIPLMTDVFGNYVIQKFFEHGDQTHKKILAHKMRGQVLQLSMQMYGCRVVQKALDHVLVDQQTLLLRELEGHVLKCVKDQNGNHVIQKAIERCPSNSIAFITAAFHMQVQHLSIHPYGCRVIQRCLEKSDLPSKPMIMSELMDGIQTMISDQFGNYVVQRIVTHDEGEAKRRVLNIVGRGLEGYSKHKFASNVVEKCLEQADDAWRRDVMYSLVQQNSQRRPEGEGVLVGLIKDNFGNYVIQKLLDTLNPDDYYYFVDVLQTAMNQAKRTGCGKQVLSIDKKMHRFGGSFRHGGTSSAVTYNSALQYSMPLPPPPRFASNFTSAATTPPPPLTADTHSLQSSGIPSINGDTVEGASVETKSGDLSDETIHH